MMIDNIMHTTTMGFGLIWFGGIWGSVRMLDRRYSEVLLRSTAK